MPEEPSMKCKPNRSPFLPLPLIVVLVFLLPVYGCLPGHRETSLPKASILEKEPKTIRHISLTDRSDAVIVNVFGNGPLQYSSVKKPVDPPMVVIYFPHTRMGTQPDFSTDGIGPIRSIRPLELTADGSTTAGLEISVTEDVPYEITTHGNALTASFKKTPPIPDLLKTAEKGSTSTGTTGNSGTSSLPSDRVMLHSIDTEPYGEGVRIHIRASGTIRNYTFFTMDQPPNIVFDLKGVRVPNDRENRIEIQSPWVWGARYFGYQDDVRLVLSTQPESLSLFSAHPTQEGMTIVVGKSRDGKAPEQGHRSTEDIEKTAWINSIDFISQKNGKSSVILGTDTPVQFQSEKETHNRLLITLLNTRIPARLAAIRYENAQCRVESPRRSNTAGGIIIPIQFHRKVPYFIKQTGNQLVIQLDSAEPAGVMPAVDDSARGGDGLVPVPPETEKSLLEFLRQWKKAWENTAGPSGDIASYISFYSGHFSARGLDRNGWKQDRRVKNSKRPWIRGRLIDVKIRMAPSDDSVILNFFLEYVSPNYTEVLDKTLAVRKHSEGWKIVREVSRMATDPIREKILQAPR